MKAARADRYGGPEVVELADVPGPGEVLVRVGAAALTTADWRIRASAFPGGLWLAGRLVAGLTRPRHPILDSAFSGSVAALGPGARGFAPGDPVFGFAPHGAHAELLTMKATGAIAPRPTGLTDEDAASLPFGGASALVFLRDVARLERDQRLLILGASGAVGVHAVQIARAMGAHVTAVASGANEALLRRLGAHDVLDYRATDPLDGTRSYDVILDTVGVATFRRARAALTRNGQFVPLNYAAIDALRALFGRLRRGPRMRIAVSSDSRATLDDLAAMVRAGTLRLVIERVLPFADIRAAHRLIETRHRRGSLILQIAPDAETRQAENPTGETPPD